MSGSENDSGKVERYAGEKEIIKWNFRLAVDSIEDLQNNKKMGEEMEIEFHTRFRDALCGEDGKQGWARTIIVDSLNTFKQLQRQRDFGSLLALNKKRQYGYGELNNRFEQLHILYKQMADISNSTYLVYIGRASDEYKPKKLAPGEKSDGFDVKTGKIIYDVYSGSKFDTEIILRSNFDKETHIPSVTVEKPYLNAYTTGTVLSGDQCCFESIIKNQMDMTEGTREKLMNEASRLLGEEKVEEAEKLIEKAQALEFDISRWL